MNAIDVKVAAATAISYLKDLYSEQPLYEVRLEEVWLSDDEQYWFVTIGFDSPKMPADPLAAFRRPDRECKVFKIGRGDGRVLEMKMR